MLSYNMITVSGDQPEWQRTALLCDQGRIFIPAEMFGKTEVFLMSAAHDGEALIFEDDHLYLSAQYLAHLMPELESDINRLELSARRAFHSAFFTGELK